MDSITLTKYAFPPLFIIAIAGMILLPGTTGQTQQKSQIPDFSWPIKKGKYPDLKGITSTFAESRSDHFHNGVDIASQNDPVRPVSDGKIIYSREHSDNPWKVIPGPGNYIIISHKAGWMSGYYHLKHNSIQKRNGSVDPNTIIAKSGNTGHSVGAHLHFIIADKFGNRIQNPMAWLPAITDTNPPIIGQLILETTNGQTRINHSKTESIKLTKPWPFMVTIIDPGFEKNSRRGIHKLSWVLNNKKEVTRIYDSLELNNNEWVLENKYSFDESFYSNYYFLGQLDIVQGKNTLHLTASDIKGNTTSVIYTININKQY